MVLFRKQGHRNVLFRQTLRSAAVEGVVAALRSLASPENFRRRYEAAENQGVILFPVRRPSHERKKQKPFQSFLTAFLSKTHERGLFQHPRFIAEDKLLAQGFWGTLSSFFRIEPDHQEKPERSPTAARRSLLRSVMGTTP